MKEFVMLIIQAAVATKVLSLIKAKGLVVLRHVSSKRMTVYNKILTRF